MKRIGILKNYYQWRESTGKRRLGDYSDTEHYEMILVGTSDAYQVVVYSFNAKRNA